MQFISKNMYLPFRGREGGGRGNLNSIETDVNLQAVMMNVVAPPRLEQTLTTCTYRM